MSGGQNYSKKTECIPKDCSKFNPYFKNIDIKNAIAYLKLRTDGCPKQSALQFCSKTVCKSDSTKDRDGPSNFRTLKIRKEENPVTLNGWLNAMPMFDMGKNYISSIKEILVDDEDNGLLNNIREDDKLKHKFNSKIKNLYNYYTELKETTSMPNLRQKQENVQKIRRNFDQIKKEIKTMIKDKAENGKEIIDEDDIDELATKRLETEANQIERLKSNNRRELMQKVLRTREDLSNYASKVYKNKEEQKNLMVQAKNEESRKKMYENIEMNHEDVMFKDLEELIQYADYLKRMIDEVEIDANGIIKKTEVAPQTAAERERRNNHSSKGLSLLKKSVEVAKEFNQANYLFFRKDDKDKFETEFEKDGAFTKVVDDMDTLRISDNIQLDMKNTKLLINEPQNFKKYFESYSDLNHNKDEVTTAAPNPIYNENFSIGKGSDVFKKSFNMTNKKSFNMTKERLQSDVSDNYGTNRGFYDRQKSNSFRLNSTGNLIKNGVKRQSQHPRFITLGQSNFLKSKNYGNMLSETNRNKVCSAKEKVRGNPFQKCNSKFDKAYESGIGFGGE